MNPTYINTYVREGNCALCEYSLFICNYVFHAVVTTYNLTYRCRSRRHGRQRQVGNSHQVISVVILRPSDGKLLAESLIMLQKVCVCVKAQYSSTCAAWILPERLSAGCPCGCWTLPLAACHILAWDSAYPLAYVSTCAEATPSPSGHS